MSKFKYSHSYLFRLFSLVFKITQAFQLKMNFNNSIIANCKGVKRKWKFFKEYGIRQNKDVQKVLSKLSAQGNQNQQKMLRTLQKEVARKSRSRSPLIYKGKSPAKGSTYFDYYNTNKQTKVMKKISYEEQSTKSRKQKTSNASRTNQQYFQKNGSKKSLSKYSSRQKQSWLLLMSQMMKKWEQMDNKHSQQLSQLGDLQQHERKRLLKIHQIEREKLKKQIQNMKSKMYSHKKLNKGF